MPKTFDGIQAMAYLKQGYAVRRVDWKSHENIFKHRDGGVLCECGYSRPIHLDIVLDGEWEFYCNPAAEPMEPTPGTWEWAKAAIEQGKKVRCATWVDAGCHVYSRVIGRSTAHRITSPGCLEYAYCGEHKHRTDWEEYIEPQAPKKGMTWGEARALLSPGVAVRRRAWVGLRPPKYVSHHVTTIICDEDEAATDWEVVTNPPGKSTGMTWEEANEQLNSRKRVKRIGWRHGTWLRRGPYGADSVCDETGNICSVCDTDKNASDWEAIK